MTNINLLPWRTTQIFYKNNIFYALCLVISISVVILCLFGNVFLTSLISAVNEDLNSLEKEINIYKNKTKEIEGLKTQKKLLLNKLQIINSLESKRTNSINILTGIAKATPPSIILQSLEVQDQILLIKGLSEANSSISLMMINLENLPVFIHPVLLEVKSYTENKFNNNYNIAFTLRMNIQE